MTCNRYMNGHESDTGMVEEQPGENLIPLWYHYSGVLPVIGFVIAAEVVIIRSDRTC